MTCSASRRPAKVYEYAKKVGVDVTFMLVEART